MNPGVIFGVLTLAALCAATGQLLFKVGASGNQSFTDYLNVQIFCGLAFYGVGTTIWIYALASQQLVTVYAFTALTFVLVYLAGVLLLGETLTTAAAIGVGCVMLGLYLITVHGA